jgi:hypothetical protein
MSTLICRQKIKIVGVLVLFFVQTRIEKAQKENPKCKVRKDSVKFIDTIVTASPEFFERRPAEETEKYFKRALEFLQEEVGADNIFSAVIHMDERNPHMHLCFVPLTKDKRLSAKEVMGDRNKLIECSHWSSSGQLLISAKERQNGCLKTA